MCSTVTCLVASLLFFPLCSLCQPAPAKLNLMIVEGEGAINNISQRIAREPIIQVEDENRKPVSGAVVTFLLPENGASGVFLDGSKTLVTITDESGRAAASGLRANKLAGKFQIRVTASFQGAVGNTVINQVNALVAAAAAGGAVGAGTAAGGAAAAAGIGKVIAIVAIVAGAAVGGGLAAASKGGSSSSPAASPPAQSQSTILVPGSISVRPPQ